MAGATGLEPATSGVTGRHSNQLNYAPIPFQEFSTPYSKEQENPYSDTFTILTLFSKQPLLTTKNMVGGTGLEPVTFGL